MKIPQVLSHVTVATAAAIVPRDGSEAVEKREDWTGDGNVEIYISDQSRPQSARQDMAWLTRMQKSTGAV